MGLSPVQVELAPAPSAPPGSGVRPMLNTPRSLDLGTCPTEAPPPATGMGLLAEGSVLQETYEVRGVLGHGGMASVYAAFDRKLRRQVAIKVPGNEVAARTMHQEAQALAAFRHPGLPAVYAMGSHDGWPFIAMERIQGRTLEQAIDDAGEQGLPLHDALRWLLQLVEVVGVLHHADLAHRDLKPENVMLAPGDRMVLLDLGIMRQERTIDAETSISGSPHYMAPETVRGDMVVGQAHLVDIYALGVTAYQMLTGRWPYDGDTVLETMHMQLLSPVPRVSHLREVPPLLDDIVQEMMAKDPQERPPSIAVVSEILHKLREGRTSLQRRPGV